MSYYVPLPRLNRQAFSEFVAVESMNLQLRILNQLIHLDDEFEIDISSPENDFHNSIHCMLVNLAAMALNFELPIGALMLQIKMMSSWENGFNQISDWTYVSPVTLGPKEALHELQQDLEEAKGSNRNGFQLKSLSVLKIEVEYCKW